MAVVPVASLELEGNAAYRYGGRLFLMSCDREDQRRKTDEHKRICKHISVCNHRAPPLKEVDNLAVLTGSRIIAQSAAPCQFAALGRLFHFLCIAAKSQAFRLSGGRSPPPACYDLAGHRPRPFRRRKR